MTRTQMPPETAAALRRFERNWQRAQARAETARASRNAAVTDALDAGYTHAAIAQATGMTVGRVGQLAVALAKTRAA